jgi:hypothetical protein
MDDKCQWLAELKEFILESEKRICEKLEARIQSTEARVATLEAPRPVPRPAFALSRQSTSAGEMEPRKAPMHLVSDDSRYSAWSYPEVEERAFADTPTQSRDGQTKLMQAPKVSAQSERGRPTEKVNAETDPIAVQQPIRSATPDKMPGESTWKPTFLNKWASAPAAFGEMFQPQTVGACEDCLRPDCVAWVEGQSLPVAVSTIKPGQRVLCHDNLARGLKYAEVTDVLIQSGSAEWVTVVLEDGTHLEMTANHPTQPLANDGERSIVRSGDLRPGLDHLMVLKTCPVLVKEVIHQGVSQESDNEQVCIKDRCFLTLRQPERHALFVAPPPDTMSGMPGVNTMAVGSADAKPIEQNLRLNVRNTFFDTDDPDMDREAGLPRSNSLPRDFNFDFKLEPPVKVPLWRQSREFLRSSREYSYNSNASMSSYCSSAYSEFSAFGGGDSAEHRTVIVAPTMQPKFQNSGGGAVICTLNARSGQEMMALSEIGTIKKLGLRSIGGVQHSQGTCTPCLFANRQQHDGGAPCWKGMFCERCHEDHDRLADKKPKSGRMRQKLAKSKQQA